MVPKQADLPIRLANGEPDSVEFYKYLRTRCEDRLQAERLTVYLHQWDNLSDRLGRAPSPAEYAEEWDASDQTSYRLASEFKTIFPTEESPMRILRLLWDGMGSRPSHLFSVKVVEA